MNKTFIETFVNPPEKTIEETKQKVLFIIGGISKETYAFRDVVRTCNLQDKGYTQFYQDENGMLVWGTDETKYKYIKEIDCEQFLDSKAINFFERFLLLGLPFRLWDKFGDYFKAIKDKKRLEAIANLIANEIGFVQAQYGVQVDVWAHSLGTLLASASRAKVDEFHMFGSPLTSKFWSVRKTAQDFKTKLQTGILAKSIYYHWSPKDIVCTKPVDSDTVNAVNVEYNCKHDLSAYLAEAMLTGSISV